VRKLVNEGKAMALNDGLRCANGEIFLIMDADAVPDPQILKVIVPHFKSPRVGAVTGNPRVYNRGTLLCKLQAIEFTAIISLQRRSQRVWGRILTMSGVVGAFHRSAILDAGLYSPDMATEDIDLSWKLQLKHWDIRYEPRAVVWMRVPAGFRGLWRQRRRWARGLAQVLRRHGPEAGRDQGELVVAVDVPPDKFGLVPVAAGLRPLHDGPETLGPVEAYGKEDPPGVGPHGGDVREGDRDRHPAALPVGHPGEEIRLRVEHVGRCHEDGVPHGEDGAVVLGPVRPDQVHDGFQQVTVIHPSSPPSPARSCTP